MFHCLVINVRCHFFSQAAHLLYHILIGLSSTFFKFFKLESGEGGIWTLAPLLTTYSLSRGAPSASLGTSPNCPTQSLHFSPEAFYIISRCFRFVKNFFNFFSKVVFSTSGESGIRTHAPLRTNGFQDRLVMTTSISLHMLFIVVCLCYSLSARCILSSFIAYVNNKFHIFSWISQK